MTLRSYVGCRLLRTAPHTPVQCTVDRVTQAHASSDAGAYNDRSYRVENGRHSQALFLTSPASVHARSSCSKIVTPKWVSTMRGRQGP